MRVSWRKRSFYQTRRQTALANGTTEQVSELKQCQLWKKSTEDVKKSAKLLKMTISAMNADEGIMEIS